MVEKTLEIRGINRSTVIQYLLSLGAKEDKLEQATYISNNWKAHVSKEYHFHLFHSDIPKVYVTFTAKDEKALKDIIASFRLKTFRVGG